MPSTKTQDETKAAVGDKRSSPDETMPSSSPPKKKTKVVSKPIISSEFYDLIKNGPGYKIDENELFDPTSLVEHPIEQLKQNPNYFSHSKFKIETLQLKMHENKETGQSTVQVFPAGVDINDRYTAQLTVQGPPMVTTEAWMGMYGTLKSKTHRDFLKTDGTNPMKHCQRLTLSTQGWMKGEVTKYGLDKEVVKFIKWLMALEDRIVSFGVQHDQVSQFIPSLQTKIETLSDVPANKKLSAKSLFTRAVKSLKEKIQKKQIKANEHALKNGTEPQKIQPLVRPFIRTSRKEPSARGYLNLSTALYYPVRTEPGKEAIPKHGFINKVPLLLKTFKQGFQYNYVEMVCAATGKHFKPLYELDMSRFHVIAPKFQVRVTKGPIGGHGLSFRMLGLIRFPHTLPKPSAGAYSMNVAANKGMTCDLTNQLNDPDDDQFLLKYKSANYDTIPGPEANQGIVAVV